MRSIRNLSDSALCGGALLDNTLPLSDWVREQNSATSVSLFIGPEGDFTPDEYQMLADKGMAPVWLGPHVLRADTAAVSARNT